MSSLACQCVFYRPEHNTKGGSSWNWFLMVLKWNIPTDRAQSEDEKMVSFF